MYISRLHTLPPSTHCHHPHIAITIHTLPSSSTHRHHHPHIAIIIHTLPPSTHCHHHQHIAIIEIAVVFCGEGMGQRGEMEQWWGEPLLVCSCHRPLVSGSHAAMPVL